MAGNTFGKLFKFTTWGESHGPSIGCVVDGVPPRIELDEGDIQFFLDKRRPGSSAFVSQRNEADKVKILSGLFEGKTTGTPISMIIENKDANSKDYESLKDVYRPGHADYTYEHKYGIRDHRGGGRASARETAMRIAAGAIARKVLGNSVKIQGAVVQLGDKFVKQAHFEQASKNSLFCPDANLVQEWENYLREIKEKGTSVGAVIEIRASGVPVGLGEPVYDKLDADLAKAMMSINAVKAVEIGEGFNIVKLKGKESSDKIRLSEDRKVIFETNRAGGILGGISTGQDIVVRFAVKPTSSIALNQEMLSKSGNMKDIAIQGRHDPCVGIRAVPVGEAMMACVLADHLLRHKAQCSF